MRIRNAPGRCSGILQKSSAELSDAELLAFLLGPGPAAGRAMHIAREALSEWGGIRGVFAHSKELARSTKGVGPAGVARLEAARELVLRQLRAELQGKTIRPAQQRRNSIFRPTMAAVLTSLLCAFI